MKLRFSFLFALLSGLSLGSCTITVPELDETTLSLDTPSHIEVSGEGGEQLVKVSTTASNWTALAGAPWITAIPQGQQLALIAAPNTTGQERSTTVVITAGQTQQKINLRQAAKSNRLELSNNSLHLTTVAGTYVVDLSQAEGHWSATMGEQAAWLKVVAQPERQQLHLTVEENATTTERVGKVYLRNAAGTIVRDLTVHQAGRPLHLLPSEGYFESITQAILFEQARGANLMSLPFNLGTGSYVLSTQSPLFANITYTAWEGKVTSATLNTREALFFRDKAAMLAQHNFFLDEGFQLTEQSQYFRTYLHPSKRVRAVVDAEGEQNTVRFEQLPEQTESFGPVKDLPIDLPEEIDRHAGADELQEMVLLFEMEQGNELDEAQTLTQSTDFYTPLWFNVANPTPGGPVARVYFLRNDGVSYNGMVAYSYHFAQAAPYLYLYKGVPFVTREFHEYLAARGYRFFRAYDARIMYASDKDQQYITFSYHRSANGEGYVLEVMVQFYS